MRIACPSCHAVYDVPPGMAEGRRVRCARCRTEFAATGDAPPAMPAPVTTLAPPPKPPPAAPAAAEPPPRLVDPPDGWPAPRLSFERPHPARPPAARWRAPMALGLSVLVVVAALLAATIWRADIMRAWPPSQRLFQPIGLN